MSTKQRTTSVKYDKAFMTLVKIVNRILRDGDWVPAILTTYKQHAMVDNTGYLVTKQVCRWVPFDDGPLRATITVTPNGETNGDKLIVSFLCKKPPHAAYLSSKELELSLIRERRDSRGHLTATSDEEFIECVRIFDGLFPEKEERRMSAEELEVKYLELNGGYHPTFTVDDWKEAVMGDNTREGYWGWVVEEFRHEAPRVFRLEGNPDNIVIKEGNDQ